MAEFVDSLIVVFGSGIMGERLHFFICSKNIADRNSTASWQSNYWMDQFIPKAAQRMRTKPAIRWSAMHVRRQAFGRRLPSTCSLVAGISLVAAGGLWKTPSTFRGLDFRTKGMTKHSLTELQRSFLIHILRSPLLLLCPAVISAGCVIGMSRPMGLLSRFGSFTRSGLGQLVVRFVSLAGRMAADLCVPYS